MGVFKKIYVSTIQGRIWLMPLQELKIKLFSVLMDFKDFQTRFTPFTVETNYILTTI